MTQKTVWLVLSAPMGAGKDTISGEVLTRAGWVPNEKASFADPLKADIDQWLGLLGSEGAGAVAADAAAQGLTPQATGELVARLSNEFAQDPQVTARSRTPGMRALLQWYGTDVRRSADPDYWVGRMISYVKLAGERGVSIATPDARFVNEIETSRKHGAICVRLEVSPEEQRRRLLARDGALPDSTAFQHVSETVLANYDGFDAVIDTTHHTVEETLEAVAALLPRNS